MRAELARRSEHFIMVPPRCRFSSTSPDVMTEKVDQVEEGDAVCRTNESRSWRTCSKAKVRYENALRFLELLVSSERYEVER